MDADSTKHLDETGFRITACGQWLHALCNAHHLRELQALTEIDGKAWARPMQDVLQMAGIAAEEGCTLPPDLVG